MTTGLSKPSESILMPVPIKPKKSTVPGRIPSTADLSFGEVAVNLADKKIYSRDSTGIIQLALPTREELRAINPRDPSLYQHLSAVIGYDAYSGRLEWDDYPATGQPEDSPAWTIYRITTNSAGDVVSEQSATGAWSSKQSLPYS
jgi:hypothetical protein